MKHIIEHGLCSESTRAVLELADFIDSRAPNPYMGTIEWYKLRVSETLRSLVVERDVLMAKLAETNEKVSVQDRLLAEWENTKSHGLEKIAAKVLNDYFTLHSPPPTPQAATAEPLEDLSSSAQSD